MANKRLRIAIVGPSPCDRCHAACCKQNGCEFSVLLAPGEYGRFGPFAAEVVVDDAGRLVCEKVLPYRGGRCIFLGEDDLCTIYEDRPASCRRFECTRLFHNGGVSVGRQHEFIRRNPRVGEMLEHW
jgi:Fe-S-cluster containining protein